VRALTLRTLQVAGFVNFTNRGNLPLIVSGGQVTICNGFFAELNATTKGAPINAGCSGSSYSIPLRRSLNPPKSAPGGQAVVPFEGTVTVNRITAPTINGNGINGPVATAYVDAYLTTGGRVVSTPQRFSFDISPGAWRPCLPGRMRLNALVRPNPKLQGAPARPALASCGTLRTGAILNQGLSRKQVAHWRGQGRSALQFCRPPFAAAHAPL
jgi:hypothetical protein